MQVRKQSVLKVCPNQARPVRHHAPNMISYSEVFKSSCNFKNFVPKNKLSMPDEELKHQVNSFTSVSDQAGLVFVTFVSLFQVLYEQYVELEIQNNKLLL